MTIYASLGAGSSGSGSGSFAPNTTVQEFDDFLSDTTNNLFYLGKLNWSNDFHNFTLSGGEAGHDGVLAMQTGDSPAGMSFSDWNGNGLPFILGSGQISVNWVFKFTTLSAPGARYFAQIGLGSNQNTVEYTDGCYFQYEDDVNSGNWVLKTASASVRTSQNTTTAVTTSWTNLGVVVNAAASSVSYFINGVQVGTPITTNIPTAALSAHWNSFPNGGTSPLHKLDLFYYTRTFTTPR